MRRERYVRTIPGIVISVFLRWRIYNVIVLQQNFGADRWVRFGRSGLILGAMYALIAIGYTLVDGIIVHEFAVKINITTLSLVQARARNSGH